MGMFIVSFDGNVGKDPEVVKKGDLTYVRFSVATRHYNNQTRKEATEWVQVTSFDPKTIGIAKGGHLRKGEKVVVSGKLTIKSSETNDDVYFDVVGTDITLMTRIGNTPAPDATTQGDSADANIPY